MRNLLDVISAYAYPALFLELSFVLHAEPLHVETLPAPLPPPPTFSFTPPGRTTTLQPQPLQPPNKDESMTTTQHFSAAPQASPPLTLLSRFQSVQLASLRRRRRVGDATLSHVFCFSNSLRGCILTLRAENQKYSADLKMSSPSHTLQTRTVEAHRRNMRVWHRDTREEAPFRPHREGEGDGGGGGEDTRNHGTQRGMSEGASLA